MINKDKWLGECKDKWLGECMIYLWNLFMFIEKLKYWD